MFFNRWTKYIPLNIRYYDENACKLENGLGEIENTRTKNEKDLKAKENGLAKATISLENIVNNSQMPVEKKDKLIKEKTVNIELLNKEIGEHKNEDNRLLAALVEQKKAIDNFKKQNKERLPNSYTDATFQIAFDITFSDNSVVYKQYNGETGEFELSQNPDRDIRFQNAMHIPYF